MKIAFIISENDRIKRCDHVGVGVALLEQVRHQSWDLRFQCSRQAQYLFLLYVDLIVEFLNISTAPCLPVCYYVPGHEDNGQNF